jgi:hypothetical protein
MAESESEHAGSEEEDVEECPGARDKARRRAAASTHEAAARAAALAEIATRAAAPAMVPGSNAQRRGTKRSAHAAGHDAETTGDVPAAQRDASARDDGAAEETHGPGAPSSGQVELTKPVNWASMSLSARKHWKKNRGKHNGKTCF